LATEQLFELPADMFKIVGYENPDEGKYSGKDKKHKKPKENTKIQEEMSSQ